MATKNPGPFSAELLDALLEGRDRKSVLDSGGLIGNLKKALAERMLNAEMDVHLESDEESSAGNHRNGTSARRC
jgi:putative transposase